jgi:hypothetical protein
VALEHFGVGHTILGPGRTCCISTHSYKPYCWSQRLSDAASITLTDGNRAASGSVCQVQDGGCRDCVSAQMPRTQRDHQNLIRVDVIGARSNRDSSA